MAKLTVSTLTQTGNETTFLAALNGNFTAVVAAVENTLSRDGTVPNEMTADLDMNSNDILNAGSVFAQSVQSPTMVPIYNTTAEMTAVFGAGGLGLPGFAFNNETQSYWEWDYFNGLWEESAGGGSGSGPFVAGSSAATMTTTSTTPVTLFTTTVSILPANGILEIEFGHQSLAVDGGQFALNIGGGLQGTFTVNAASGYKLAKFRFTQSPNPGVDAGTLWGTVVDSGGAPVAYTNATTTINTGAPFVVEITGTADVNPGSEVKLNYINVIAYTPS